MRASNQYEIEEIVYIDSDNERESSEDLTEIDAKNDKLSIIGRHRNSFSKFNNFKVKSSVQ